MELQRLSRQASTGFEALNMSVQSVHIYAVLAGHEYHFSFEITIVSFSVQISS